MKAIFDSKEMKKALSIASESMQKNVVMPVLSCVKLDFDGGKAVTVTTSNLKTTTEIVIEAFSKTPFSVLVLFDLFASKCDKAIGQIELTKEDSGVILSFAGNKSKIKKYAEVEDFPKIDPDQFYIDLQIDGSVFHAINKANSMAGDDSHLPHMHNAAIHFKKKELSVIGCSPYGFYINTFPIKCPKEEVVQLRGELISITKQFQDSTISVGEKFIRVNYKNITITSQRTELPYCAYTVALDRLGKVEYNISVDRDSLRSAIEVANDSFTSKTSQITLSRSGNELKVESNDNVLGKEDEGSLPASFTSDEVFPPIRFNGNMMLAALKTMEEHTLCLSIRSPDKQICITQEENKSILAFIQPLVILNN